MTIYNLTNFTSAAVANKILGAMQDAIKTGLAQYVPNRNGRLWLRVDIKRDDHGRLYFQFLTDTMQEVGHHLLKAALFRLPQHPLDTILDAQEAERARKAWSVGLWDTLRGWLGERLNRPALTL